MYEFIEFGLRGVLLGVTYGLLAFPISLLFIATDTVDLAVGGYAVLAGAVAMLFGDSLGPVIAIMAGVMVAVLASSIVGGISLILGRTQKNDPLVLVLASFGFALFIESFVLTGFGQDPFIRQPFMHFWSLWGIRISPQAGVNVAVGLALVGAVYVLLYRTAWGRDMRASANNERGAALAGIPVRRLQFMTFMIAGALAGIAGVLVLYSAGMDFASGLHLTLAGFGAAIVFGLHGPLRGFFGGLAIGVVETISAGYASGGVASLVPLAFIFAVLTLGRVSRDAPAGGRA
ncbi:branched-chain amino acid ABC transporter permease [Pikeienuella sp. HZG-20]|uniref:branched-chain amino acid ABC transporter permease n=1 Tax=Paludibacillus litoralis TaxID=3133267 RepID=UPI0030EB3758